MVMALQPHYSNPKAVTALLCFCSGGHSRVDQTSASYFYLHPHMSVEINCFLEQLRDSIIFSFHEYYFVY